jgi:Holliday junction resolvase RusA-like endonuclease
MDATSITFEIPGEPIPQPRARWANGHTYTPSKNGINVYKRAVALAATARAKFHKWDRTEGPVAIDIEAVFQRPPSHLTKGGELRAGAPGYPGRRSGDNDNIEKGVWDAITVCGAIWTDDSQIVDNRCRKRYAARGEPSRTVVTIRRQPG